MKKKLRYLSLAIILLSMFILPLSTFAHPGKIDAKGGHYCWTNCAQWALKDGEYHYHNTWVKSGEKWYYYQQTGYSKGWKNINSKWYYFDNNGVMKIGWVLDNNNWYYLGTNGDMQTGWILDKGTWYYLDSSGAMQTGWIKQGATWYYLSSSGAMKTGWLYNSGHWYFLDSHGAMQTGWVKVNNKWYYLNTSGSMQVGWLKDKGKWYLLNSSGAMLTGWVKDNDNWYYLKGNGEMAANLTIDGYKLGSDGAWLKTNEVTKKISSVTNSYGVRAEAVDLFDVKLLKGKEEIGGASFIAVFGDLKYRDMIVDIALSLYPNIATKNELNQYIDKAIGLDGNIGTDKINVFQLGTNIHIAFDGWD